MILVLLLEETRNEVLLWIAGAIVFLLGIQFAIFREVSNSIKEIVKSISEDKEHEVQSKLETERRLSRLEGKRNAHD